MPKRITLLLLSILLLISTAFSASPVTATLPADTSDITGFTLEAAFSAEKSGYQTVGWLVEAAGGDAFDAFIGKYRDSLVSQGFVLTKEVHPAGLNAVYYFFDHPDSSLQAARMNGIDFDLFLCGETSGSRMAMVIGVVPGIEMTEPAPAESWSSVFGETEPQWQSVLADVPAEHAIPSFESFAEKAILSTRTENGHPVHTMSLTDVSAFLEYAALLEEYGLSGMDGSEVEYGLPLYSWLEDCEWDLAPQRETVSLAGGETGNLDGYVFFTLNEQNGTAEIGVWYAHGVHAADLGKRWSETPLEPAVILELRLMFAEARIYASATPTPGTVPIVTAAPRADAPTATPRAEAPAATSRPASNDSGTRCSTCGGDGYEDASCSSCGGDGDVERSCSNCGGDGDRDCMSCAGKGYDNCSGCYGSGDRRCGACYGTGRDGDRRCSSCSGRGEKTCSSCSGSGRKRCSACSGSGDRDCTYCGGDGRKEQSCTSCGGDGRDTRMCTSCGGDGKR